MVVMASMLLMMLMSVNVLDILTLTSNECNQSGIEFIRHNQQCNRTHYREHLESQNGDPFDSLYNKLCDENPSLLKGRDLETVHIMMDPQQPLAKTSPKTAVHSFTNNLKISSSVRSCIEACFYSVGVIESTEDQPKLDSMLETTKSNRQIVTYCTPETGSNCSFIDKL